VNGSDVYSVAYSPDGAILAIGSTDGVTIWNARTWRPLPSAVEMQGHLAHVVGMQPWELRTNAE
jgi:WD40 repeat protein